MPAPLTFLKKRPTVVVVIEFNMVRNTSSASDSGTASGRGEIAVSNAEESVEAGRNWRGRLVGVRYKRTGALRATCTYFFILYSAYWI